AAVKVELLRGPSRTLVTSTMTDLDGNYHFKIPAPDSYWLRAETPSGRVPLNNGLPIEMEMGNAVTGINSEIEPRPPPETVPALANRVLHLSGGRGHVSLPANVFGALEEATVEGWVKWDKFTKRSRFFDFGKQGQAMWVESGQASSPGLLFR